MKAITYRGVPIVLDGGRRKGYTLISGLEALQLGIPAKSVRGPVMVNQDVAYVDDRRLKRQQRIERRKRDRDR